MPKLNMSVLINAMLRRRVRLGRNMKGWGRTRAEEIVPFSQSHFPHLYQKCNNAHKYIVRSNEFHKHLLLTLIGTTIINTTH